MNKSFIKHLLIIGLAFQVAGEVSAQTPVIRQMNIRGNTHFRSEQLLDAMNLRAGMDLPSTWPASSLDRLFTWYHNRGYLLVCIDSTQTRFSPDSQFVDIDLWISEGNPVRVGRIQIETSPALSENQLESLLNTRTGQIYQEAVLGEDVEQILTTLENRGYPLSSVEIESLSLVQYQDGYDMDVVLKVEEGPLVRIGSIKIEGNSLTKNNVILRESRLKLGSLYNHQQVLSTQENLQKLAFFQEVGEPEILFVGDRAMISLRVTEGNANTLDGVIGYAPAKRESSEGYFTGRLQFAFRNLFGTGRFFEAYWEKKDAYSQAMQFGYEEPWLFGWPAHLGGAFHQEIRDTTYIERAWEIGARYTPWSTLSLHVEGGRREVLPDSLGSVLYQLPQTKSWLLSLGIDYNTLNDPVNPTGGVRYRTTLTTGWKQNITTPYLLESETWKPSVSTRKIEIDAELALSPFRYQVLYLGLHGIEVRTDDRFVALSDQVRFGGTRSLRGYKEDAFRGSLVAWINGEYRYLTGRRSRVFIFIDGGIYQRREEEAGLIKGMKIGYGFGIRLDTRLGLIGIDYGMGEGDSLTRGKIHVGLVNAF